MWCITLECQTLCHCVYMWCMTLECQTLCHCVYMWCVTLECQKTVPLFLSQQYFVFSKYAIHLNRQDINLAKQWSWGCVFLGCEPFSCPKDSLPCGSSLLPTVISISRKKAQLNPSWAFRNSHLRLGMLPYTSSHGTQEAEASRSLRSRSIWCFY